MSTASTPTAFYVTGINLKSTGATTIVPSMSGKSFLVTNAYVNVTAASGAVTIQPVAVLQANAAAKVVGKSATFNTVTGDVQFFQLGDDTNHWIADLTNPIEFNVTVASNRATSHTADVYVEGIVI